MNETFTSIPIFIKATTLTRQQRVWVALYSLNCAGAGANRSDVLLQNSITEADMAEFSDSWLQFRSRVSML
ncbi:hypothetical protein GCM10027348_14520 [Hymenobacter tenuis]